QSPRGLGRDPAPFRRIEIGRDIIAIARIVIRIDKREILTRPHRPAVSLDTGLDHFWTADENRFGDPFLDDGLGRAQHPFILAFRVNHALGASYGGLYHG